MGDLKAFLQIVLAVIIMAFGASVLFCALLGDILRLNSCDTLLIFVIRSWLSIRQLIGM
jgi:hypothetical protein